MPEIAGGVDVRAGIWGMAQRRQAGPPGLAVVVDRREYRGQRNLGLLLR